MRDFHELTFWNDAMDLTIDLYKLTASFPKHEVFGLASQMQRCASSIPSNVAEGCGRNTNIDFAHFLDNALGSSYELETQLILSFRLGYLSDEQYKDLINKNKSIQRRIVTFLQKIRP